jgi:hypothetical protein
LKTLGLLDDLVPKLAGILDFEDCYTRCLKQYSFEEFVSVENCMTGSLVRRKVLAKLLYIES